LKSTTANHHLTPNCASYFLTGPKIGIGVLMVELLTYVGRCRDLSGKVFLLFLDAFT